MLPLWVYLGYSLLAASFGIFGLAPMGLFLQCEEGFLNESFKFETYRAH
jgi:hypothetical protein